MPDEAPAAAAGLVTQLLSYNAAERPSAYDVIKRLQALELKCKRDTSLPMPAGTSSLGRVSGVELRALPHGSRAVESS